MNRSIKWLGQVDDPCASIQAALNAMVSQKVQVEADFLNAILAAQQSGAPQSVINEINAQKNSALQGVNAQINGLQSQLTTCKNLTPGCIDNTQCPAGQVCVGGKCVTPGAPTPTPQCSPTNPCPAGQTCVDGTCVSPTPTTKSSSSSGWGLAILGTAAAASVLFLGPAIFGKGGASGALDRVPRLQLNRRRRGYTANRRRRGY